MWGNFVPDLGKLGEQLTAVAGEALQKATADVEKSIDSRLGIKEGPRAKASTGTTVAVEAQPPGASVRVDGSSPLDPTTPIAAPGAKPGQKKVVKKIVRRVVKGSGADLAAAAGVATAGTTSGHTNPIVDDATATSGSQVASADEPADSLSQPSATASLQTSVPGKPFGHGGSHAPSIVLPLAADSEPSSLSAVRDIQLEAGLATFTGGPGASSEGSEHRAESNRAFRDADANLEDAELSEDPSTQHQHPCYPSTSGHQAVSRPDPSEGELGSANADSWRPAEHIAAAARGCEDGPQRAPAPVADGWDAWRDEDLDLSLADEAPAAASARAFEPTATGQSANGMQSGGPLPTPLSGGDAGGWEVRAKPARSSLEDSSKHAASADGVAFAEEGAGLVERGPAYEAPVANVSVDPWPTYESVVEAPTSTAAGTQGKRPELVSNGQGNGKAGTAALTSAAGVEANGTLAPAPGLAPLGNGITLGQRPPVMDGSVSEGQTTSGGGDASPDVKGGNTAARSSLEATTIHREVQELQRMVAQLQGELQERDTQLHVQAVRVSDLQQVVAGLQTRNEELALRSAGLSEADFEAVRTEFEQRLAAAERKVYALTKERDALRKGAEKLADYGALVKEKDDIIKQVMDEGEKLSKKQVDLEGIIKRLRGQLAAAEGERDKLAARLATEESGAADLRRAKAKLEKDLVAAAEQAKVDLDAQKEHFEMLLQKAKSDQVDAEERARDAAAQGLGRKLRESEARCEALAESCADLRDALDRQRQAADLREEMLKADITDLERRCQAAELRHQDLASKMPEATRPLLRQIEAMQAAMEAQAEAWAGAEATLHTRITDAESRAATAGERERLAVDKMQLLSAKVSGLEASLSASRSEVRLLNEQLEEAKQALAGARDAAAAAVRQAEVLSERCRFQEQQMEQLEMDVRELREAERTARAAAEHDTVALRREYERRLAEADSELTALRAQVQAEAMKRNPEPPAMAAPGYRWVLLKEGEQPPNYQQQQQQQEPHSVGAGSSYRTFNTLGTSGGSSANISSDLIASLRSGGGVSGARPAGSGGGGSGVWVGPPGGGGGGGADSIHAVMASELESLRAALRAKTGELATAQQQVAELEATRDRLAEELVAGSTRTEAAEEALQQRDRLEAEMAELRTKLSNALELVGERDEQVEELLADLQDVKCMYKDQIEFMCQQLLELQGMQAGGAHGHGHGHGPAAPGSAALHSAPGRPPGLAGALPDGGFATDGVGSLGSRGGLGALRAGSAPLERA